MSFAPDWPVLWINYIVARDDDVTGDPVLPGYGDQFFALVRRLPNGQTMWRSISLQTTTALPSPAAARSRDSSRGGIEDY